MAASQTSWGIRLDAERISAMRKSGAWHDRILTDFFDRNVIEHPDAPAVLTSSGHDGRLIQSYPVLPRNSRW